MVATAGTIVNHARRRRAALLWVDCTAGAFAGLAVLALSGWLSDLYRLPRNLLLFIAAVNLLYACYSFALARRARRPLHLIALLACANAAWVPFAVRPHWGKLFTIPSTQLLQRYEMSAEFKRLVAELDPRGKFRNAFLTANLYG